MNFFMLSIAVILLISTEVLKCQNFKTNREQFAEDDKKIEKRQFGIFDPNCYYDYYNYYSGGDYGYYDYGNYDYAYAAGGLRMKPGSGRLRANGVQNKGLAGRRIRRIGGKNQRRRLVPNQRKFALGQRRRMRNGVNGQAKN
uniref:Uncharacterized protein n=1 Tax=Parastrongyloides trichosuri TaxID=131310 RepID=A0A0N5A4S8_PARTI